MDRDIVNSNRLSSRHSMTRSVTRITDELAHKPHEPYIPMVYKIIGTGVGTDLAVPMDFSPVDIAKTKRSSCYSCSRMGIDVGGGVG